MDVNGDGTLDPSAEVFDLTVVAGGSDGTVQLYRKDAETDARALLSVVRLPGGALSVTLDATERVAYVGAGARGVAIVDLDGPASIQPIDLDRNGEDDRILGFVDTPGQAGRLDVRDRRDVGFAADGLSGAAVAQLLPPRVEFVALRRDPVRGRPGDEQDILDTRRAFVTDDAVEVEVDATLPPGATATLVIEQARAEGEPPGLAIDGGGEAVPLEAGRRLVALLVRQGAPESRATVSVRAADGAVLAAIELSLIAADPGTATLTELFVVPDPIELGRTLPTRQLSIGGLFSDGQILNLTRDPAIVFASAQPLVATVDAHGLVSGAAGGAAEILVSRGPLSAVARVLVDAPPVVIGLQARQSHLTFRRLGVRAAVDVVAVMSNGTVKAATDLPGTAFESSAPGVVSVAPDGVAEAAGAGVATVFVTNGPHDVEVQAYVEPRPAAVATGLQLAPLAPVRADEGSVTATALLAGTGGLDTLLVTFVVDGAGHAAVDAAVGYDGRASARLTGLASPGTFTVRATLVDAGGSPSLSDSKPLVVLPGPGDHEPNDSLAAASLLVENRIVTGSLGGADRIDVYRLSAPAGGGLTASATMGADAEGTAIELVARDGNGVELARSAPGSGLVVLDAAVPAGVVFMAVELRSGSGTYQLQGSLAQGPLTIVSVVPASAPPGTTVRITGSGFSTDIDDVAVAFGSVAAKVVAVTPTTIDVVVPANAIDGPLAITVGSQGAPPRNFAVGNPGPLPEAFAAEDDPANFRLDPTTGRVVDVTRLIVDMDPSATRAQVDALIGPLGGVVAGFDPLLNSYVLDFPANTTLAGLAALQQQVEASPLVDVVVPSELIPVRSRTVDLRDRSGAWPEAPRRRRGLAYDQVLMFDAIEAVRRHLPGGIARSSGPGALKKVKVAVIDTGFNPKLPGEFSPSGACAGPDSVVRAFKRAVGPTRKTKTLKAVACSDVDGHGTAVTGIIGALNNGTGTTGALPALFESTDEAGQVPAIEIIAYGCETTRRDRLGRLVSDGAISHTCSFLAYNDIIAMGDVDLVNMSYGGNKGNAADLDRSLKYYRNRFGHANVKNRTLYLAAAGNESIDATVSTPSAVAATRSNVMSVGAVAVSDVDASGEAWDERARFYDGTYTPKPGETPCVPVARPSDGSNCNLLTVAAPGEDLWATSALEAAGLEYFNGTSGATPLTASIAALLQAARQQAAPLAPSGVRDLLVRTGDDLTGVWTGLGTVPPRVNAWAAVRRVLPPAPAPRVWVGDEGTAGAPAAVIGLPVDAMTGAVDAGHAVVVPLLLARAGVTVAATQVLALAPAPGGDILLAAARTSSPAGDGLFVLSTISATVEDFLPLSGQPFPAPGAVRAVRFSANRVGLEIARDGRLAYVTYGEGIAVANLVNRRMMAEFAQFPAELSSARDTVPEALPARLGAIATAAQAESAPAPALFTDLAISPRGDTLFALVQTGTGGGRQPGFVLTVDVDTQADAEPATKFLDPDLLTFLGQPILGAQVIRQTAVNDEPSAIAVSPSGNRLYMTNGGADRYWAVTSPEDLPAARLAGTSIIGMTNVEATLVFDETASQFSAMARDGFTLLEAPGFTALFDLDTVGVARLPDAFKFPSAVAFGWNPPTGRVVNQLNFREVYGARPSDLAIRFDGRRALVPFFQTGNFGVFDLQFQGQMTGPALAGAPAGSFGALVAVTPSVELDAHLWPARAEDEALLFPNSLVYAQNGRFAVAAHAGGGQRGGAISVIDDRAIGVDLATNASESTNGRPFFATEPLCRTRDEAGRCVDGVVNSLRAYRVPGGGADIPFRRPRAIAIDPFLSVAAPKFGDPARLSTSLNLFWRDPRAASLRLAVADLGPAGSPGNPAPIGPATVLPLQPGDLASRSTAITLGKIAAPAALVDGNRYRVTVEALDASGQRVSQAVTEIVFVQ